MLRTGRVFVLLAVCGLSAGISLACSQSRLAESGGTPTTPPALGTATPTVTADSPTTAVRELPAVCGISDAWGLAIIRATDPEQAGGLGPAALEADLDEKSAALIAAEPSQAEAVTTRTEVAKRKLAGTATEADLDADEAAVEVLHSWYTATCR